MRAPADYGRVSGERTEAVVASGTREVVGVTHYVVVASGTREVVGVTHYVITERYTHQWKALPFNTNSGMAIPIFDDEKRAQGFIDANWESLGPGWKPQLLWSHQLAYVVPPTRLCA